MDAIASCLNSAESLEAVAVSAEQHARAGRPDEELNELAGALRDVRHGCEIYLGTLSNSAQRRS
jgi:hypothetical protein